MAENDKVLLRRYHEEGDLQAREQLIEQYMSLVRSLARRYSYRGEQQYVTERSTSKKKEVTYCWSVLRGGSPLRRRGGPREAPHGVGPEAGARRWRRRVSRRRGPGDEANEVCDDGGKLHGHGERGGQLARGLEARFRIAIERAHEEVVHLGPQIGIDARRGQRGLGADLGHELGHVVGGEGQLPGEGAVGDDRERPEIAAGSDEAAPPRLLGAWA